MHMSVYLFTVFLLLKVLTVGCFKSPNKSMYKYDYAYILPTICALIM